LQTRLAGTASNPSYRFNDADSSDETSLSPSTEVCEHSEKQQSAKGEDETVDKRLKSMIRQLGDAINSSLSDSEEIAEVISRIKAGGYDVFVVLEATIGFNENDGDDDQEKLPPVKRAAIDYKKITAQDRKFLKSLRISLEEE
jgi:hypothetical protein